MADAPDKDQQTEAPTQKRRADAARKGDLLQSRELATALAIMVAAGWLALVGPIMVDGCRQLLADGLSLDRADIADFDPFGAILSLTGAVLLPLALLFALSIGAAIAGTALLGSAGFRDEAIAFKGSRINPLAGIKRIFGLQGLVELAKALTKGVLLGFAGYWLLADDLQLLLSLGFADPATAARMLGTIIVKLVFWLGLALALLAAIDVPLQYFRRMARLKMSRQELKDEMKESDGSPEVKQAIRARQAAMANASIRKGVAEATVIITNPTHFAVALRYAPERDFAPIVVARGRDEIALAMRLLASEQSVPMLEYPQLTRAIYFSSRVGQPVSEDLYVAVATVLAFVFNLDRAMAETRIQPDIDVPLTKRFDEHGNPPSA